MNVLIITSNKGKRHRNVTLFLHNLIEDTLKIKCVHISDGKHTEINHIINLVVCLNKDSVYFANYYANKKFHVPCIYFFTASSYIKDYPISMNLADRFVMIQDCYIQYDSMLPNCIKICQPCYDISKQNSSEIVVPQISVLIAIDSFMQDGITFFNIIKQINQLDQFNFTIIAPKCFSKWVNKNIRIEQKKNFELLCMNSSFIVGSGEYIFKAIKMHKPCIILGDRGYGGILDVLNFELQYKTFFQGRVGAEIGESVPFDFLRNDLIHIDNGVKKNNLYSESHSVLELLKERELDGVRLIEHLFYETVKTYEEFEIKFEEKLFVFSTAFVLLQFGQKGLIINVINNKIAHLVDYEEIEIINFFKNPNSLSSFDTLVIEKYDFLQLKNYIKELYREKIIILVS